MYVCICRAVTDRQIRDAIRQGCCTRKDLVHCLKVGVECGKCKVEVRHLLKVYENQAQRRDQITVLPLADPLGQYR